MIFSGKNWTFILATLQSMFKYWGAWAPRIDAFGHVPALFYDASHICIFTEVQLTIIHPYSC